MSFLFTLLNGKHPCLFICTPYWYLAISTMGVEWGTPRDFFERS